MKLKLEAVAHYCDSYIERQINYKTGIRVIVKADENGANDLRLKAVAKLKNRAHFVLSQSPDFKDLCLESVVDLFNVVRSAKALMNVVYARDVE